MANEAKYQILDADSKEEWDEFVTKHKDSNFLQSWDFYVFYQDLGRQVVRRVIKQNSKIVAAYAGEVEPAKRGRHLAIAVGQANIRRYGKSRQKTPLCLCARSPATQIK